MSNYSFVDPSTIRKDQIVKDRLTFHEDIPMFSILEFNIFGTCTRRCTFCPISLDTYKKTNQGMDVKMFEKTVKELAAIGYAGKILFSGFSEPLLHKQIKDLFRLAKTHLPEVKMEIVSNGDLFERTNLKELFDAGLDTMSVSLYDGPQQLEELKKITDSYGLTDSQVIFRRRYFDGDNWGMTISNRSGLIDSNEYRDKNEEKVVELPLKSPCFYPYYMIMVDYNGDVILCPHDWNRLSKMGNLNDSNIWDLWKGKYMQFVRSNLSKSNRCFKPCNTCDVKGNVIGKENFEAWQNLKP